MVQFGTMIPSFELKLYEEMAKHIALVRRKKVRADLKKLFWGQKLSFYFQEFQVFVYFRQYWTDKRLAHGTEATLMLGGTDVNRIWLPDTYINNANDHEVFQDNQLVLIDKKGQIVYFAYARIAAACQMKLVKFPMDVQQCHLTLESCKYELLGGPV